MMEGITAGCRMTNAVGVGALRIDVKYSYFTTLDNIVDGRNADAECI